jgi:predicted aspartyl protease
MSIGVLIAVAVGSTVGTLLTSSRGVELWNPNTGQLDDQPPQILTLLDSGQVATVPIVSPSTQLPEIELIVNGRTARFMVDTGSSHVWILSNGLEQLGLRAEADFNAHYTTAQGRGSGRVGYVKQPVSFELGKGTSLLIENVLVLTAQKDLSYIGIVSGSFLETIGGNLDFRDRMLRIDGPRARPASTDQKAEKGD